MDEVARFPAHDRSDLFQASAAGRKLAAAIIEKDFWVCWTLRRLFTLPKPPAALIFKGGTSLSKVFGVIDRFSEDIDLSFNRHDLGFTGDTDPATATSGKKRQRSLDELIAACQALIREAFLPALTEAFSAGLGTAPGNQWNLVLAEDDPDGQTILFTYPAVVTTGFGYIRPAVRLELGARSDHWPAEEGTVIPYAAQDVPQAFTDAVCAVHVLSPRRTFWEKATILHAWYHAPSTKVLQDRQSRHYYDLVRLYQNGIGRQALQDSALLAEVVRHKQVFFASGWARYEEAKPGTLRLVPPMQRIPELQRDYQNMQEMFFTPPPKFDVLLDMLREMEVDANK